VRLFIERDLAGAEAMYLQAQAANSNEPLAWLFMASVHAHREHGAAALDCVDRARRLSPLDPMDHYINGVAAWATLAAGDAAGAEQLALRAMRSHCTHRPTFITLAQALALQGKEEAARAVAARLLALAPGFSVQSYLQRYPGGANPFAHRLADALHAAGVPK
jgi:adenylate cyclase